VDTVRLARDIGDVSGLLPTGISSLREIPFQFQQALKAALIYLSFEEMIDEDRPPRSIWSDTEMLNAHMDRVRRKYRERGEGRGELEHAQQNDAARMLIAD
jgi:hypothetical protein